VKQQRRCVERQRLSLTIDDLRMRDVRAYEAFMIFTELSVGSAGDICAEDGQMDTRIQWIPAIGRWE
jgi:hypothetical protein